MAINDILKKSTEILRLNKKEISAAIFGLAGVGLDAIVTYVNLDGKIYLEGRRGAANLMHDFGVEGGLLIASSVHIGFYTVFVAGGKLLDYNISEYNGSNLLKAVFSIPSKIFIYSPIYLGLMHSYGASTWLVDLPQNLDTIMRKLLIL